MAWSNEQLLAYKLRLSNLIGQPKHEKEIADEGLERELDSKIAKYIDEKGYYAFHDYSRGKNKKGHPDWTIALPHGKVLFIENKSKHGRLSEAQKFNMLKLMGLGQKVYECRSFKQFLEIINENMNV